MGMTREHPLGNTPQAHHPLGIPRGGLAVVARTHKSSLSNVSILFFLNLVVARLVFDNSIVIDNDR
jgi:hypothetical protein